MDDHTAKAFDLDLRELESDIAQMGASVKQQIETVMGALETRDSALAHHVILADTKIDALQNKIEEKAVVTIARRQPMAVDLRQIVGALRIANDFERMGDLADNIAKRILLLSDESWPNEIIVKLEHMVKLVVDQLSRVLDSYVRHDAAEALDVWRNDEEVDWLNNSLFRELLTHMMEDPRNITFCTHLLFCAKNIERMGDHVTNVAESVYYIVEGRTLMDERPKADLMAVRPESSLRQ
ncbi:MAG: phosphate signaling complex protein PhoU [Xanthobacteraceae bacterium]